MNESSTIYSSFCKERHIKNSATYTNCQGISGEDYYSFIFWKLNNNQITDYNIYFNRSSKQIILLAIKQIVLFKMTMTLCREHFIRQDEKCVHIYFHSKENIFSLLTFSVQVLISVHYNDHITKATKL